MDLILSLGFTSVRMAKRRFSSSEIVKTKTASGSSGGKTEEYQTAAQYLKQL